MWQTLWPIISVSIYRHSIFNISKNVSKHNLIYKENVKTKIDSDFKCAFSNLHLSVYTEYAEEK